MFERLWIFHCGYIPVPRGFIIEGGGFQRIPLPFMAVVARHAEHGPVLFDAPFGHEGPGSLGRVVAGALEGLGLEFRSNWAVVPRLESLGFRAGDVDHVFMTHLHIDHTGAMKSLSRPTFHVSREEWEYARGLSSFRASLEGYVPDDYEPLEERVETFEAPTSLSKSEERVPLLEDGSLEAVGLPGHTPGHVGYELEFESGETVLHVGDAAFALSQVTDGEGFGYQPEMFASDLATAESTLRALRDHVSEHPDHVLVNAHDHALAERCMDGPIALID